MSGRHRFQGLIGGFTPGRRHRVEAKKAELMAEMPLRDLRPSTATIQLPDADHQDLRDNREMFTESHGGRDDQ